MDFENMTMGPSYEINSWNFQKIVVVVAIVLLILILAGIAYNLEISSKNYMYPPVLANCPDYWEQKPTQDGSVICQNKKNLGKKPIIKEQNFSESMWKGKVGLCAKSMWAINNDLTWDGITNNPQICD